MQTLICLPLIGTWGSITKNFLGDCTRKGEHNSLKFLLWIFLSYATVAYLILAQARNHTKHQMYMRDMIWFLHWRSPSSLRHDLHPSTGAMPSPRRPSWSLQMSNITYRLRISRHTPEWRKKVRNFHYVCKFYVASRAFTQESFLIYEHKTTTLIVILLLWFPC
jgi:hypothetical protein